ncbi:MAG: hypothetical protein K6A32_06545 [Bacteroidales bacterium]|nr:hypothetical protein [Bacteroidales bacterium]
MYLLFSFILVDVIENNRLFYSYFITFYPKYLQDSIKRPIFAASKGEREAETQIKISKEGIPKENKAKEVNQKEIKARDQNKRNLPGSELTRAVRSRRKKDIVCYAMHDIHTDDKE